MSKILLINQPFYPDTVATSQQVTDMARYLVNQDCQVSAIADSRAYEDRSKRYPMREQVDGIDVFRVWSTGFGKKHLIGRLLDAITFQLGLFLRLILMPKQDSIVAYTSPPFVGLPVALYCKLRKIRFTQWVYDLHPDAAIAAGYLKKESWVTKVLYRALQFILKQASYVVVLDKWMGQRVAQYGADKKKVIVVPPWPVHKAPSLRDSVSSKKPSKADNPFRKMHALGGRFVVLYSGNHSVMHPLDTILKAAVLLKDDPNIVFVFVGGGVRVKDVTRYIEQHDLSNVKQLPFQPREALSHLLSSADVHLVVMGPQAQGIVHPSKIYGVLASGKPYIFVGPKESTISELLKDCPFGFNVPHHHPEALVEAIRTCQALTPEQLEDFDRNNTHFVKTRYSIGHSMQVFLNHVL